MAKPKKYTVVGLYTDNKQVFVTHLEARTITEAVFKAKQEMKAECCTCTPEDEEEGCSCDQAGAVLSVFGGKHKDLYGEDELYQE